MEVEQPVMRINPLYQELHPETLASQMLYFPVIVLVDGLHNQLYQKRAFVTQFTEIDVHPGMAEIRCVLILQEVFHFDVQHFRFVCVLRIKGIKAAILTDNGKVCFTGKTLCRSFYPDNIFRPVRFPSNNVVTA